MKLLRSSCILLLLVYLFENVPKNCEGNLIHRRRSRNIANKSGNAISSKEVAKENTECVNECCKNCVDKCVLKDVHQNNKTLEFLQNNRSLGLDQSNNLIDKTQNNKTFERKFKLTKREKSIDMIKLRNDKLGDKFQKSPNEKLPSCRSSRIIRSSYVIDKNNEILSKGDKVFDNDTNDQNNKTLAKLAKKF